MLKEIKGRQCLICRPMFKDADRLTFGLGFVGISFEVIVLHCVEVCIYIQLQMMEKRREKSQYFGKITREMWAV